MAVLLDLPDELLVLIIDQALGAFLPACYKSRQQTACALSLVSRRLGALARSKVLEVVQINPVTEDLRDVVALLPHDTSRIRALSMMDDAEHVGIPPECIPLERCLLLFWRSFAEITSLHIHIDCALAMSIAKTFPSLRSLWLDDVEIADAELIASPTIEQLRIGRYCSISLRCPKIVIDEHTFPALRSLAFATDVLPLDCCTSGFAAALDELVLLVRECGGLNRRSRTRACPPPFVDVILGVVTLSLFDVTDVTPYRHVRLSSRSERSRRSDEKCSAYLYELANRLADGQFPNLALLYIPASDDFPPDAFAAGFAALHTAGEARGVEVVVDPECCDSERGEVFSAHFRAYRRRMRAAEKVASDQKDEEL